MADIPDALKTGAGTFWGPKKAGDPGDYKRDMNVGSAPSFMQSPQYAEFEKSLAEQRKATQGNPYEASFANKADLAQANAGAASSRGQSAQWAHDNNLALQKYMADLQANEAEDENRAHYIHRGASTLFGAGNALGAMGIDKGGQAWGSSQPKTPGKNDPTGALENTQMEIDAINPEMSGAGLDSAAYDRMPGTATGGLPKKNMGMKLMSKFL